jgi:YidC/Oxa1 family membrane protein insertase
MEARQRIVLVVMMVLTMAYLYHVSNRPAPDGPAPAQAEPQDEFTQPDASTGRGPGGPPPSTPEEAPAGEPAERTPDEAAPQARDGDELAMDTEAEDVHDYVEVQTPNFRAVFSTRGAALRRYELKDHFRTTDREHRLTLLDTVRDRTRSLAVAAVGDRRDLDKWNYRLAQGPAPGPEPGTQRLVFRATVAGWRITRTYTFAAPDAEAPPPALTWGFRTTTLFENVSQRPRELEWSMRALAGFLPDDPDGRFGSASYLLGFESDDEVELQDAYFAGLQGESVEEQSGTLRYMGLKGRFFTTLLGLDGEPRSAAYRVEHLALPPDGEYAASHPYMKPFLKDQPHSARMWWTFQRERSVSPGSARSYEFTFYGGPVQTDTLAFEPAFNKVVSLAFWSTFDPISKLLSRLLHFLYRFVPNFGICIILLTLIIKSSMHGLSRKALVSGHKMQKLQPLMKELKEKYKDDQARLQQETMRLWREHGVSPWGSCLPMLLQIPVFIALFGTFARDFSMRQAMFIPGWIEDLSQPDALFALGFEVPFFGWDTFNLLPVLFVGLQLFQQSMTPKSNDPQMAQQQQMMKMMPIFFVFIFYDMPAGLVLYFTISAAYTLVEHWFIRRNLDNGAAVSARPAAAAEAGAGAPAGAGVGTKNGRPKKKGKRKR